MSEVRALPAGLGAALPEHLGHQRWYAGPEGAAVEVVDAKVLWEGPDGAHRLWWAVASAGGVRYQLVIGERPGGEPADFLSGQDGAIVWGAEQAYFYDATADPELALQLLRVASGGARRAERVRRIGAEQSNTSLVYDDELILKLYRRLAAGPNPDVVVTQALVDVGFSHVAEPLVTWRDADVDLAFGQAFLAGASEGWALALTSLRDLYSSPGSAPGELGGDFAAEASRLGQMTAEMHLALGMAFGVGEGQLAGAPWQALVDSLPPRLDTAATLVGRDLVAAAQPLIERLRAVGDPGPALRVHGDYHLGQVMWTDAGWYVLDFEGEPARSLAEREARSSPLKDVTGMRRSFHYAARSALGERLGAEQDALEESAAAWEARNSQAFTEGYRSVPGIDALLPGPAVLPAVLRAYELDKALYELGYEQAYRPEWVSIPLDAVTRLVEGRGADA